MIALELACDFEVSMAMINRTNQFELGASTARLTYFSSSLSLSTSNDSSHPTSISTLTPPSSSNKDCEAVDSERAPCRGQKVNIVALSSPLYLRVFIFQLKRSLRDRENVALKKSSDV